MMMMAPAILLSIVRRDMRNCPIALADAPSATKTIENPRMKASDVITTRRLATGAAIVATAAPPDATTVPPRMSSTDTPDT